MSRTVTVSSRRPVSVDMLSACKTVAAVHHHGWTVHAWRYSLTEAEVTVEHNVNPGGGVFEAYLLWDRWRCHGIGRSNMPDLAKRLARRALRALPTKP